MGNINAKDPDFWCSSEQPEVSQYNSDWMSGLPDTRLICDMSIPGTHNTMSFTTKSVGNIWVWCQTWPLRVQLDMGIRFLDLRCRHFRNSLPLHHADYFLNTHLDQVLRDIVDFLKSHSSEVIIVNIQKEHKDAENTKGESFDDIVKRYLAEVDSYVYKYTSQVPNLGAVRGKMVIMSRSKDKRAFLCWGQCRISNDWNNISSENKWSNVKRQLDQFDSDKPICFVTFTSHTYGAHCPSHLARTMNPKLHSYVNGTGRKFGILAIDFPGCTLIRDIINHN